MGKTEVGQFNVFDSCNCWDLVRECLLGVKGKEVTWNWQHNLSVSDERWVRKGLGKYAADGAGRLSPENTETEDGQGQALEEKQERGLTEKIIQEGEARKSSFRAV